jgi:hypothetical protein
VDLFLILLFVVVTSAVARAVRQVEGAYGGPVPAKPPGRYVKVILITVIASSFAVTLLELLVFRSG